MPAPNSQPNIVLMVSHDLGDHIGPYGKAVDQSEHLMALARESVRSDGHFVTSPGCSQSRSSLVTGRYPHSNGQFGLATWGWKLKADELLLPAVLKSRGYHTRLFGVWHLHEWTLASFDKVSDDVSSRDSSPEGFASIAGQRAADWIKDIGSRQKPFYLHVGFWEVHRPFCGDEEQQRAADRIQNGGVRVPDYLVDNEPTRREIAELHQSVGLVDQAVGNILASLNEAGLSENTLVIFTADHGLPFPRAKGTLYDPGIKVAFLARWPGVFTGGETQSGLTSNVDLMPTLLEAVNVPIPQQVQGESFFPTLRDGVAPESRRPVFAEKTYHEHYDPIRCLRTEDYKYIRNFADRPKLVLPTDIYLSPSRVSMAEDERLWGSRDPEELYDLRSDPGEEINLAANPESRSLLEDFRSQLNAWMESTDDPLRHGAILRGPEQVAQLGGPK